MDLGSNIRADRLGLDRPAHSLCFVYRQPAGAAAGSQGFGHHRAGVARRRAGAQHAGRGAGVHPAAGTRRGHQRVVAAPATVPPRLGPGLHWIVPYSENVMRYSISNQTYTMVAKTTEGKVQGDDSVSARTADGQLVYFDASVIYAANPDKVVKLHIQWQGRYEDEFVRPRARSLIYNRAAQFTVEQIYGSKRTELQQAIQDEISKDFEAQGLTLVQFLLRNISFSPEYAQAVEQKQIAQQNAERAKFLVQQQEQEAARVRVEAQGVRDAAITRAEGESKALQLVADALRNNPDLIQYTYVQKIAPNISVIVLPGGGGGGGGTAPYILDLKQLLEGLPKPTATAPVTTTTK